MFSRNLPNDGNTFNACDGRGENVDARRASIVHRAACRSPLSCGGVLYAYHNSSVHNMSTILHPNVRVRGG